MHVDGPLEVWNVTDRGPLEVGAQSIVPIVGRIDGWSPDESLTFSLDGGEHRPVYVSQGVGRLSEKGDFAIDAIDRSMLGATEHHLELRLERSAGPVTTSVRFRPVRRGPSAPDFDLDTTGASHPEEVVQVVDGRWQLAEDGLLRIAPGDEGYDRMFLVGRDTWTTGYRVDVRFTIDRYLPGSRFHAFGPLFKWRPHRRGDGHHLPRNWTAGLGIFSSSGQGLAIRYGDDVEYLPNGRRIGNTVLARGRVDPLRWAVGRASTRAKVVPAVPQFPVGTTIRMSMLVDHGFHRLELDAVGLPRARRVIEARAPEPIETGCVGFMTAHTAATVHELRVTPTG